MFATLIAFSATFNKNDIVQLSISFSAEIYLVVGGQ